MQFSSYANAVAGLSLLSEFPVSWDCTKCLFICFNPYCFVVLIIFHLWISLRILEKKSLHLCVQRLHILMCVCSRKRERETERLMRKLFSLMVLLKWSWNCPTKCKHWMPLAGTHWIFYVFARSYPLSHFLCHSILYLVFASKLRHFRQKPSLRMVSFFVEKSHKFPFSAVHR